MEIVESSQRIEIIALEEIARLNKLISKEILVYSFEKCGKLSC
jgi:hypothetical protein